MEMEKAGEIIVVREGSLVLFTFLVKDGEVVSVDEAKRTAQRLLATAMQITDEQVDMINWKDVPIN